MKKLVAICLLALVACSKPAPVVIYDPEPALPPPGTKRMCWEEPLVKDRSMGPGMDERGEYYHPEYSAVQEVKMGRWVPCDELKD